MRFGPVRLLGVLLLLLAGGLAWLWVDQQGQWRNLAWSPPKALAPDIKVPARGTQATGATGTESAAILARPLFAPDRRPPPPPAPPAAPPPPDPLADIQIQGIFSGANVGILARVDGKVRRIKVNDTVGPWTLKGVEGREVTFGQGDETRKLRLDYAPLGRASPQALADAAAKAQTQGPTRTPLAGQGIVRQNSEDAGRENIRRRNELRAARGLPLITE